MLFEARGKVVSGGVDVTFFRDIAEGPEPIRRGADVWTRLLRVAQTIEDLPVPTVFAAHGLTLTAAFELALCCDVLLAAEKASFGLVEIVVGLTPSMGGPQRLAERAGPARARELIFTGERYPAAVLERWNVVNRVLPDDGFAEAARGYAHRVAAGPTVAHAATKKLVAASVREGARAAATWGLAGGVFKVRARQLLAGANAPSNRAFLSGLLIGAEMSDLRNSDDETPIQLCAPPALKVPYCAVMEELGLGTRLTVIPADRQRLLSAWGQAAILLEIGWIVPGPHD